MNRLRKALVRLVAWARGRDRRFPRQIKGYWYCGKWYLYLGRLRDEGVYFENNLNPPRGAVPWPPDDGSPAFNHFRCGIHQGSTHEELIDGLIPAVKIDGRIGLYSHGGQYGGSCWDDNAGWDDGRKIDLQFVRAIPEEERDAHVHK